MTNKYRFQTSPSRRGLRWIVIFLLLLAGVLHSEAQSYDWGNVAIGGGGFVSAVIAAPNDPNVFYARTDVGGAYRWNETTQTWIPLTDWVSETERGILGVDGIAVDPNVAGRVYMLAGTSYWNNGKSMFLRSDDYGNTWEKFEVTSQIRAHGNGMGRGNGERIAVDPNNSNIIFIGSRFDGMWKSTDRGSFWTQVSSFPVTTTANEAGTSIVVFDPSSAVGGVSQTIYAGVAQANNNLYVSHDAGASWSLVANRPVTADIMPQRMAVTSDGNTLYVTYGNGAGPHAQLWGGVTDYYNRGAIYKYDVSSGTWTDISPENYMQDLNAIADGPTQVHYGAYSGISIDPNNENRILATSINSWRGPQYWNVNGTWEDSWGDNIFLSEDGGQTWREMFRFYWTQGGQNPDYQMVDANGITWVAGETTCHWNSSAVIDPFNSNRAFVTSGNGVWGADSLLNFYTTTDGTEHGKVSWKFKAHGIEETVPHDLVSVPGGPLVSVIFDYDGFRHTDVTQNAPVHTPRIGSTTGLAMAAQNTAKLVRVGVSMYYSNDTGTTWTQTSSINGEKGKVALSADGTVLLHSPSGSSVTYRSTNNGSSWTTVSGLSISDARPVADPVNSSKFYAYDRSSGAVMLSADGGSSFSQVSTVAADGWRKLRAAPGREGDIWIALDSAGLVRSTNSGSSFSTISGISICRAVGFGKAASGANYPAVYIWGTINGVTGIHQSIDEGATWVRVNDDEHEYGGPANGEYVVGDMNIFGRVYMSTAGRGIVYGEPGTASDFLTISPVSQTFTSADSSQSVTVSSNVSWTVSDDQSWITTSVISGTGDGSFSVLVTANTTSANRTGTVTISGGGITRTLNVTQGGNCTPSAITPYVQVNGGTLEQTGSISVIVGDTLTLSPQSDTGGTWSWAGPNAFSATTREVTISNIQTTQAGDYTATYTNDGGCQSMQTFSVTVNEGSSGGATGTILREYWTAISGTAVSNLTSDANYPDNPSGSEQLTLLEGPTNWADNYGTRIRGYIHPATSGSYSFWVAGDDDAELYLSTDTNPANSALIASVSGWTNSREWTKYSTQQSVVISLTAGQKYYIEVLHKESGGGDNVAVAWQGPGIAQSVIDGAFLSPYVPSGGGGAATVHIQSITTDTQNAGKGSKYGTGTISILDDLGNAVSNAAVTGTFSGSYSETVTGTTDSNGNVTLVTTATAKGSVTVDICVSNVTHSSLIYDPAQNVVTCTGSGARYSAGQSGELEDQGSFVLYPNPSESGKFFIDVPSDGGEIRIQIFNVQGKLVHSQRSAGANAVEVNSQLNSGVYIIRVHSGSVHVTRKLVIR